MELNEMIRRKDAIGYEYDEIAELAGVDEAVVKQLFEGDAEAVPKELRLKIESVCPCDDLDLLTMNVLHKKIQPSFLYIWRGELYPYL